MTTNIKLSTTTIKMEEYDGVILKKRLKDGTLVYKIRKNSNKHESK